jgi:hypothetical protein
VSSINEKKRESELTNKVYEIAGMIQGAEVSWVFDDLICRIMKLFPLHEDLSRKVSWTIMLPMES